MTAPAPRARQCPRVRDTSDRWPVPVCAAVIITANLLLWRAGILALHALFDWP